MPTAQTLKGPIIVAAKRVMQEMEKIATVKIVFISKCKFSLVEMGRAEWGTLFSGVFCSSY